MYSKEGSKFITVEKFSRVPFNQFCAFNTGTLDKSLNVVLAYRPPSAGAENTEHLCEILRNLPANSLVIGDINLPKIDWNTLTSDNRGRALVETIEEESLHQVVDFTTHIKGNILDLVITNCPEKIISIIDSGRLGKSDHSMLLIEVEGGKTGKERKSGKCWNKANWPEFADYLNVNWEGQISQKSTEEAWSFLRDKIDSGTEKFVPSFTSTRKTRPPWLTQQITREIRAKRRAWKAWKKDGIPALRTRYENLRKSVTKMIRNAKRKMEKELANERSKNEKKFSRYIRSKTKSRTTIGPLQGRDGNKITGDKDMANELNMQFSSVFTRDHSGRIPDMEDENAPEMKNLIITHRMVRKQIRKLKKDSAPGPDGITPRILQTLEEQLIEPLVIIFNKSFLSGEVPAGWKTATVVPIFKKGQKRDPANYRPVSLTSIPCKMLESIIKEEIMTHLSANNLLRDTQHGFLPGRSCATNLILTMDYLTEAIDNSTPADMVYLDFSKAFDKVPHDKLMAKLRSKGITGNYATWIENWLKGRKQHVRVNGELSDETDVESGVPQGTILGPILFDIHIDDLDLAVKDLAHLKKFADDTKVYRTVRNEDDRKKFQDALNNLCHWAQEWGMEYNIAKCKIMHLGHNNPAYEYTMLNTPLLTTESERDLGVMVDKNLKPSKQCQKAAGKAKATLMQLIRYFHYRDRNHFIRLYKTYVRPHLEFAVTAWAPWTATDANLLESVQEKAVRNTSGLKGNTYEEKCIELGLETLAKRRTDQDMVQTFKILKNQCGIKCNDIFERMDHTAGTRLATDPWNLKKKKAKKEIRAHSFALRVVDPWNNLPTNLKDQKTVHSFKHGLKKLKH